MATYVKPKNPYDVKNIGLLPPPAGHPTGVFYPAPEKAYTFTAVGVFLAAITFVVIAGRLYLNSHDRGRKLAWDDAFVVFGWIGATVTVGIWISLRDYFRRGWDLPLSWFGPKYFKSLFCAQLFLAFSQIFTKCAFIFLYFRIFSPSRPVRWSLYAIFVVAVCYPFATIGVVAAYCTPKPGKEWTVWNVPRCNNSTLLAPIIGAFNVAVDVALFVIPLFVISTLKLSRARKWSLLAIFMTGFLAIIGAAVGLAYRIVAYKYGKGGKDVNYYNFYMSLWAQVEVNFCQICSSMPAYATFSKIHIFGRFRRIRERLSSGLRSSDDPSKTKVPHVQTKPPQLNTLHFGTQDATHFTGRGNIEYSEVGISRVGMSQIGSEPATLLSTAPGGGKWGRGKWGRKVDYNEKAVETTNVV